MPRASYESRVTVRAVTTQPNCADTVALWPVAPAAPGRQILLGTPGRAALVSSASWASAESAECRLNGPGCNGTTAMTVSE